MSATISAVALVGVALITTYGARQSRKGRTAAEAAHEEVKSPNGSRLGLMVARHIKRDEQLFEMIFRALDIQVPPHAADDYDDDD